MNLEEAKLKLSKYGQEQILRYYDELSDDEKAALLEQIDKTDMEVLSAIEHKSELVKKGEITPLGAMELDEYISSNRRWQQLLIMMVRYTLKRREGWQHHLMVMVDGISL